MARTKRPKPVGFAVRPITKGLNYSRPPQAIDMRETPEALNNRFEKGRLRKRSGFQMKYYGCDESPLWIDQCYETGGAGGSALIAITSSRPWYYDGVCMVPCACYDTAGAPIDPPWTITEGVPENIISVDVGMGRYFLQGANGGGWFPTAADYGEIGVFANGVDDRIWVYIYADAGVTGVEFEQIGGDAPELARSLVIYDGRIFAGGVVGAAIADYSMIQWSAVGVWSDWSTVGGGGWTTVGDSPDRIQNMKRLAEYLIVYKERSIYIGRRSFLADPPVRFSPAPGEGIGLAAPKSIGDLGEEHVFLGWDDVYVFSLKQILPIGTRIRDQLFYGENGVIPQYLPLAVGAVAEEFNEYWLFVATGKWPGTFEEPVVNLIVNPIFLDGLADWWHLGGTIEDGGTFGENSIEIPTHGDHLFQDVVVADLDDGMEFSLFLYWQNVGDAEGELDVTVTSEPSGTVHFNRSLPMPDNAEIQSLKVSFTATHAADGTIRVHFETDNPPGPGLARARIHAVHLVRIDTIGDEYLTGDADERQVGYIQAFDTVVPLPLIVNQVGDYFADTAWVFNYEENAWAQWRIPITGFGYDMFVGIFTIADLEGPIEEQEWAYDSRRLSTIAPTNLIGQPDGRIYELADAYTTDFQETLGTPILTYWDSKDFDFDQPTMDKTFARLLIFHPTDAPAITLRSGVSLNSGETWQEQEVVVRTGFTETYVDFFVTGPQARFRIMTDSPGLTVNGISIKVIPRGEINPY